MDHEHIDEQKILQMVKEFVANRGQFTKPRPPRIVFTGKTGVGKTSTINALFGRKVGEVGHVERGTNSPAAHLWTFEGEDIRLVDLPGLGDGPGNDAAFRIFYRDEARRADGFVVVVAPPRPGEIGTLDTIRCLREAGVPDGKLVIALNKTADLNYHDEDTGDLKSVQIDPVLGPRTTLDQLHVERAVLALLKTLQSQIPGLNVGPNQVVAYDVRHKWNLYGVLTAVVRALPLETVQDLVKGTSEQREKWMEDETSPEAKTRLVEEGEVFSDTIAAKVMKVVDAVAKGLPVLVMVYQKLRPAVSATIKAAIKTKRNWWPFG